MATFDQRDQHIYGTQVNADLVDLSNAVFAPSAAGADDGTVRGGLQSVRRAVDDAVRRGELPAADGAAVAAAVDRALAELAGGHRAAASRQVRDAATVLQTAAPVATIAGALLAVWNTLSGTAS